MSVPTKPKTAEQRLEALARSASNVTLLKYNSGNWSVSEIPVPASTRFVLYPDQTSHSWTQFAEGKVVAEITAIVADDEDGDTELRVVKGKGRENLGSDDQTKWEADAAGKRRDPWSNGFALPMMSAETGAIVVFKVASVGGMGAIAEQVGSFNRNKHLGIQSSLFRPAATRIKNMEASRHIRCSSTSAMTPRPHRCSQARVATAVMVLAWSARARLAATASSYPSMPSATTGTPTMMTAHFENQKRMRDVVGRRSSPFTFQMLFKKTSSS